MIRAIRLLVVASFASTLMAASSNRAEAGNLVENLSGSFGSTTTLNGTALGSSTDFNLQAVFDPTAGTVLTGGVAVFATTVTIEIAGHGTYISAPNAVDVILAAPSYEGFYGVGLATS
jgi:hypothetical protein